MRAGEVIAKLAEEAYFMRVDNRVTQVPPLRTREADHEATSRSPVDNGLNRTRGELPQNLRGSAHVPRPASTHGQGPSLDLYGRHAARQSMASGCGSARRGWPKAMPWPRDGVRGTQPY
jgi:hypothetical protein